MSEKPEYPERHRPPHQWVANKIGYSVPGVSLLRSGRRNPTLQTMEVIEREFQWPMCDQVEARDDYHTHLNRVLADRYTESEEDE